MTAQLTGAAVLGWPRTLNALTPEGKKALKQAMESVAIGIANDAQRRVRVSGPGSRKAKTRPGPGELRATIRAEKSKTDQPVAYVKAGMGKLRRRSQSLTPKGRRAPTAANRALGVYAMVVEYGAPHRGIPAQPYMRPAREANRAVLKIKAQEALRKAIRNSGGAP